MILAALLAISQSLFESTISPSARFGVNCIDHGRYGKTDNDAVNQLIDIKGKRVITTLKGFHAIRNENHGGMTAVYAKDESMIAVIRFGKWAPRNMAIADTKTGLQVNALTAVNRDAKSYCDKHKPAKFVFDVPGGVFDGDKIRFAVLGEVPKQEDPVIWLSMTYKVSNTKAGPSLRLLECKPIKEEEIWRWPNP